MLHFTAKDYVLLKIAKHGPSNIVSTVANARVSPSAVYAAVSEFSKKGYIRREERNGSIYFEITEKGLDYLRSRFKDVESLYLELRELFHR